MNEENILNKSQENTNKTDSQDNVPVETEKKQRLPQQWKPGESGNPNGRPKGSISIVTYLKKVLEEEIETVDPATGNKGKATKAEIIARNIISQSSKGDKLLTKLLISYIDGLPTQKIKLDGNISTSTLTEEEKKKIIDELMGNK